MSRKRDRGGGSSAAPAAASPLQPSPPKWVKAREEGFVGYGSSLAAAALADIRRLMELDTLAPGGLEELAAFGTTVIAPPPPLRPAKADPRLWELALLTSSPSRAIWGSKHRDWLLREGYARAIYDEAGHWLGDVKDEDHGH